ncbi:hypothetical protein Syun_014220 [Stephania yunnanensis]|uniref:Uncharacterized protein n=1 Tax=Stephania yunnanensis TaxID=152371 RepID=A0AAP0PBM1_9MAGN
MKAMIFSRVTMMLRTMMTIKKLLTMMTIKVVDEQHEEVEADEDLFQGFLQSQERRFQLFDVVAVEEVE